MIMNVYDFDKTLYAKDCTQEFIKYLVVRRPIILIYSFKIAFYGLLYLLRFINKTKFKEKAFSFLRIIKNKEELIEDFWDLNEHLIYPWYKDLQRADDLIISASPEFLIIPIAKRLNTKALASRVSLADGKFTGLNCYGEEKVKRLYEYDPKAAIEKFYSDSDSDLPLARIAKQAYKIDQKGNINEWRIDDGS